MTRRLMFRVRVWVARLPPWFSRHPVVCGVIVAVCLACVVCVGAVWWELPDVRPLRLTNPGTTALIRARHAEARRAGYDARRLQLWVPYARLSPHLRHAVVVAEDGAFFSHGGVDLGAVQEALVSNWRRGHLRGRGGSTLTQQLARNLYLSPERTLARKFTELLIARRLESVLTKRRILEIYLNVAEWGDGIYGAEAAAFHYFGVSSAALTREQAARMAAVLVNPRRERPDRVTDRLVWRQHLILTRMAQVPPSFRYRPGAQGARSSRRGAKSSENDPGS